VPASGDLTFVFRRSVVGSFTAENVRCAILSESFREAEACLGVTFLERFHCDIDPGKGELKIRKAHRDATDSSAVSKSAVDAPLPPIVDPIAEAKTPEALLKAHGLTKAGTFYVLSGESELTQRIKLVEDIYAKAREPLGRSLRSEEDYNVVRAIAEKFIQTAGDLKAFADGIDRKYAELKKDAKVAAAVVEVGKGRLGPASGYEGKMKKVAELSARADEAARRLKNLEETFRYQFITLERRGDTYWVEVVLEGNKKHKLVLDTGSAVVLLPAADAARLGVRVPADAEIGRFRLTVRAARK
jgi:hypothetical protein